MAARLLLAMPPTTAARWTDDEISEETEEEFRRVAEGLLGLSHDPDEPIEMTLDDGALERFQAFFNENATDCSRSSSAGSNDLAAALSKLRGAAPRIALVIELAKAAETGTADLARQVSAASMQSGICIANWFADQARAIYASWLTRERMSPTAKRVFSAIKAAGSSGATRTQIRDALHRNIKAPEIEGAIQCLAAQGKIEHVPAPRGQIGRPTESWRATT